MPEEIAKAKVRNSTPEAKARVLAYRRMLTATDPERLRQYNLRGNLKKYGVTVDWFESKLAQQDGRCIICGATPDPNGVKAAARLHVDHDHDTGAVRDLLCTRCNQGLGYFRDNPDLLRAAADYIDRHRS